MKNFLKKMPVFITALSVAVVLLIVYIAMLARPVAYGMAYTAKMDIPVSEGITSEAKVNIKIKNDKVATMTMDMEVMGVKANTSIEMWIIRNGRKIAFVAPKQASEMFGEGMTEEQYNQAVEAAKADKEMWDAVWQEETGEYFTVNAFTMSAKDTSESLDIGSINAKCVGTIVFASVMGVIELAVIAFAAVSTTFFVLGRKKKEA